MDVRREAVQADQGRVSRRKVAQRRAAAEEVCWAILLMMTFEESAFLTAKVFSDWIDKDFTKWADLAVETGVMQP